MITILSITSEIDNVVDATALLGCRVRLMRPA
jgi:hypothetical protein